MPTGGARLTVDCYVVDRELSLARATRVMTAKGEVSSSFTHSAMLLMRVGLVHITSEYANTKKYNSVFYNCIFSYTPTMSRFLLHARMTSICFLAYTTHIK